MTSPARTNYRFRYRLPEQSNAPDYIFLTDTANFDVVRVMTPGETLVRAYMQADIFFGYYITGMDAPYANPWWRDFGPWLGLIMTSGSPAPPEPLPPNVIAGDDSPWIQANPLVLVDINRGDSAGGPYEIGHWKIAQDLQETRANRLATPEEEASWIWLVWYANDFLIPAYDIPDSSNYQGFGGGCIDVTLFFEEPA